MNMRLPLLWVCAAAGGAAEKTTVDYAERSTASLQKMLFVRGLSCSGCTKLDLAAKAEATQSLPVDARLKEEWEENAAFEKARKKFSIDKESFFEQMDGVTGKRAERMWEAFEVQLAGGGVEFEGDGTLRFSMPLSHYVSEHLPEALDPAIDIIERCANALRSAWLTVPRLQRRRLDARLVWLSETGVFYVLLGVLLGAIVIDGVQTYFSSRSRRRRPEAKDKEE